MRNKLFLFSLFLSISLKITGSPAFAADGKPTGTILGMTSRSHPAALVYVDVQTGEVHELLPSDACGPCFSPDGQSIAFIYKDMIYVAPRNDIEARREILPTTGSYKNHLSWTNDDYLYFGEGKTIYRVKTTGKG